MIVVIVLVFIVTVVALINMFLLCKWSQTTSEAQKLSPDLSSLEIPVGIRMCMLVYKEWPFMH